MADHTTPSDATRSAEAEEAKKPAGPGSSSDAEGSADGHQVDRSVADHEKRANERGANVNGEGALP